MRLYILFLAPPERDSEWNDESVEGCYRFLNRVWRFYEARTDILAKPAGGSIDEAKLTPAERELFRKTHWAIDRVQNDVSDHFRFNTAISALMELNNMLAPFGEESIQSGSPQRAELLRFAFDALIRCLAPMTPHICEELWERTGHRKSIFKTAMPVANPAFVKAEQFDLVIQVNSKIRARESVPSDTNPDQMKAIALRHPRVIEELAGREPRKVIVIQNRLVNIVV